VQQRRTRPGKGAPVDPAPEDLLVAQGVITDPRKSRGVRHRLLTVLAAAVCAILAGARSSAVIAEWAHRENRSRVTRTPLMP